MHVRHLYYLRLSIDVVFFFNDTATTEIYTLSLHDALPIYHAYWISGVTVRDPSVSPYGKIRSEEHTSELQSHLNLVCRLLLEKKKIHNTHTNPKMECLLLSASFLYTLSAVVGLTDSQYSRSLLRRVLLTVFTIIFFKGSGAPRILPFSPTRPSPD